MDNKRFAQVVVLLMAILAGGMLTYAVSARNVLAKENEHGIETIQVKTNVEQEVIRVLDVDYSNPEVIDDDKESEGVLNPRDSVPIINTTEYEKLLNQSFHLDQGFPIVSFDGALHVKLMPEDEVVNADEITIDMLIERLDNASSLSSGEDVINIGRIKNDVHIAMKNAELKAAKKDFEMKILRYRYCEISKEEIEFCAKNYEAIVDNILTSFDEMKVID